MGNLDGKVAIVTGGGSGIGKGIAKALAGEGCNVVIAARDLDRLESAAQEIGDGTNVVAVQTDVSSEDSVKTLFAKTQTLFGQLDILVNNSGIVAGGEIGEIPTARWDSVMAVNVRGVFICTREAFKSMKEAGGGRIINIGSISANRPREESAPYTTSKHAVTGLTRSTALDGRPHGISCGQLNPGNTAVEWRSTGEQAVPGMELDNEPMIKVSDMAAAALYMATLPPEANVLEMTVMPIAQEYVGRG
ncbi:MAG: SDR family oxidoreductase [Dehalococcoidia bacterium]|jgi:NAD(P)-dependent dehydrogenase (short-subunit alcohol dehydrogenase family)|nr:short-chain dehydrogenase [Chloroflexota bacterium]MDP6055965.1 SDR family oxidoreductase [Dehalococcoidia bacterium]MDP7090520.1 SDR family oxidoreductase [Dehalococcoidia bacterium]MDP7262029.1 SDR family oxidoreductase [Dehalococcoidia bacterium]MDP7485551.1 SDR family oxidoreductase [Dehalococcoidia bacterium]|tara:strand:- start:1236 stop:1979 length:744 start_codon:yes stop_codon:yes gene_type:complete